MEKKGEKNERVNNNIQRGRNDHHVEKKTTRLSHRMGTENGDIRRNWRSCA
jgi:hypothetical protein